MSAINEASKASEEGVHGITEIAQTSTSVASKSNDVIAMAKQAKMGANGLKEKVAHFIVL